MSTRILIADDAAFIREALFQILKKADCEIVGEAVDGEEAVEMALEKKPDVIFMDIVMPRKSGIQATQEIMNALPQTKIIACTTEGQESMVMKALEAGCCEFVIKPFKVEQIVNIVKQVSKVAGGSL